LGQPGEGVGGERHTVVGADALWQAEFFEYMCEDMLGLLHTGGGEGFAPEQEAAVVIGDGQRIAVAAVPSLEVPFEVGTPHLVGCSHVAGGGVPGCPMARRLRLLGTKLWRRVT
jgi:hypothetical protein